MTDDASGSAAGRAGSAPDRRGDFEFVEGATGDLAFVARGPTPEALFAAAAEALLAATVEEPERIGTEIRQRVSLAEPALDLLLLGWLDELIWLRDARQLLARAAHLELTREGDGWRLEGEVAGEGIGPHCRLRAEIKAATAHGLRVERTATGWEARVTLDV